MSGGSPLDDIPLAPSYDDEDDGPELEVSDRAARRQSPPVPPPAPPCCLVPAPCPPHTSSNAGTLPSTLAGVQRG